ncbi:MAG: radical SAM protein [Bacteroidales bacterium]|jgi:uncharacterized protein|nr:radical SAM protein [Bacteroidales bacterium]
MKPYIIQSVILKFVNVCNLNCKYCYVFKDKSSKYIGLPDFISFELYETLLDRVIEHCQRYDLKSFTIVFHGGEPLMFGLENFKKLAALNEIKFNDTGIGIGFGLQTNGTLMNVEFADFFSKNDIQVGFSLDGYEEIHNKHRIFRHSGKGSYAAVKKGIKIYKAAQQPIDILCVINEDTNPLKFYKEFKKMGVNSCSLLPKDANYTNWDSTKNQPIANWLITLFDIWFNDTSDNKPAIAPFTFLTNLLLGVEEDSNDIFGRCENTAILVFSDGQIRVTGTEEGEEWHGKLSSYNILQNNFTEIFEEKTFRTYYDLHLDDVLCETCRKCKIVDICGGGRLSHRYSKENAFDNPTVYCDVMKALITHIQHNLIDKMPVDLREKLKLQKLNINEL